MSRLSRNFRLRQTSQSVHKWINYPDFYAPLTHNLTLTRGRGLATFTRSTSGTCWCYLENAVAGDSPVLQVIPANIPRFQGARFIASSNTWSNTLSDGSTIPQSMLSGIMIEVESRNLYLNSALLTTQNITVAVQPYTISFYGTGSITLSGVATGTLNGTGTNNRVSLTITPSIVGTLISTVSGTVINAQIEAKVNATSYIPTTTIAITRNPDVLTFPNVGNVSNSQGTVLLEATPAFDIVNNALAGFGRNMLVNFGSTSLSGSVYIWQNQLRIYDGTNVIITPTWFPLKDVTYKIGSRWGTAGQRNWLDGIAGTNGSFDGSIDSAGNMTIGGLSGSNLYNWGGTIKNVKIWKRVLSDTDITKGTT